MTPFELALKDPFLRAKGLSSSPPARWGLLDSMSDARLLGLVLLLPLPPSSFLFPLSSPDLTCQLLIAVGLAGLHLPALDRSDGRRTSSASASSQDLFCQHLMAVGLAGPQLLASSDFNRRESERDGPRRTSTGESLSAVGLAGLQPARVWALWASPDFNQLEKMSEDIPDRMSAYMTDRMPDRMSEDMPDRMPDRISEDIARWNARWNARKNVRGSARRYAG